MNDETVQEPGQAEPEDTASAEASDEDRHLLGSGGHDISGAMTVSGVGGELLRTDEPEAGLDPVDEQGEKLGWGKDEREQTAPGSATGR